MRSVSVLDDFVLRPFYPTNSFTDSVGYLSFSSSGTTTEQVQEIADLLTGGRLSADAITAIATRVDEEASLDTKLRLAQVSHS